MLQDILDRGGFDVLLAKVIVFDDVQPGQGWRRGRGRQGPRDIGDLLLVDVKFEQRIGAAAANGIVDFVILVVIGGLVGLDTDQGQRVLQPLKRPAAEGRMAAGRAPRRRVDRDGDLRRRATASILRLLLPIGAGPGETGDDTKELA